MLGASALLLSFHQLAWHSVFTDMASMRTVGGISGGGLLLFSVIWILCEGRSRGKNRFLSFRNEGGAVNISTVAISDYLAKLAPSFPSIVKMHAEVQPVRKKIDILVDIRIKAGPQLHEICEVLQKKIRESMETGLGIKDVRHVVVRVKEISPEHKT
jgi:hypothetical protein